MGMTTYHARKAAGLCVGCGGATTNGRTKCPGCREAANASRRGVRAETQPPAPRVCNGCGGVLGKRGCGACKRRAATPPRRERGRPKGSKDSRPRTPKGKCRKCRAVPVVYPAKVCGACKPLTVVGRATARAEQIAAWWAAGACPKCGGERLDKSRKWCFACRDAQASRNAAYNAAYNRRYRVRAEANREVCRQLGLCWRCRRPAVYGYNVCEDHRRGNRA